MHEKKKKPNSSFKAFGSRNVFKLLLPGRHGGAYDNPRTQ